MTNIKTLIVFPEEVLEELDRTIKARERSGFVVEAVEEKLRRLRLEKALEQAAGIWKDRADMKTDAQVRMYVKRLRGADTRRKKRLQGGWENGKPSAR